MAYPPKLTRIEREAVETYCAFRYDGCTTDEALAYIMLMKYELTDRVKTEIVLNEKQIWRTK